MIVFAFCLLSFALPGVAWAQQPAPKAPATLRVFLDCWECDVEYQRQNVTFVDYVRDRADADLHILVTTQSTGSGGSSWTVKFIGLGRFLGQDRTFTFTTPQSATSDDRRKAFARVFKVGLAGFAADTPAADELDVTWQRPSETASAPKRDPWNYWVFRISTSGSFGGERASKYNFFRMSINSSRTTELWKINLSVSGDGENNRFLVADDRTVRSKRDSWQVSSLVVKSLGGKAAAGFRATMSHSSFANQDRSAYVAPGIEYDFFPYRESNRRSLAVQYLVGATHYKYRDVTIFDKLQEMVPNHSINVSMGLREPWGSVGAYSNVTQHLNHSDRYRASVSGNTDVRLFKGFSFNMFAFYSKINDQISLRKGTATTEEILLRLRQLATGYSYHFSLGISYNFGSIYNNVVNPRFTGSSFF